MKIIFNKAKKSYDKIRKSEKLIKEINSIIYGNKHNNSEVFEYEYLYPRNIECDEYIKILNNAVLNYEAKNIALSGGYGVGKSSVLKTYMNTSKGFEFINISLANFCDVEKTLNNINIKNEINNNSNEEEGEPKKGNIDEKDSSKSPEIDSINKLEEKILKQMFYKVKYNKIPFSRYRKIEHISKHKIWTWVVGINIFIIMFLEKFKPAIINDILKSIRPFLGQESLNKIISFISNIINPPIMLILTLIIYIIASYKLIIFFKKNMVFGKWNIKSKSIGDIEIGKGSSNDSIFNRNIDEILYFFEATNYNVVIFEDLDRFNNLEIFVRLRELNMLINNSEQINRKVTFIYAIRDSIFNDHTERTKFFDLIVPVIPVINGSNSINNFKEKLGKDVGHISEELLDAISTNISDMRTLINICNEFKLYKKRLNIGKFSSDENSNILNKLLSIIVYKNIEPADFEKLHNRKGLIGNIFNSSEYRKSITKKYRDYDIDKIESDMKLELENINKKHLKKISDLQDEYLIGYIEMGGIYFIGYEDEERIVDPSSYMNYEELKKYIFSRNTINNEIYKSVYSEDEEEIVSIKEIINLGNINISYLSEEEQLISENKKEEEEIIKEFTTKKNTYRDRDNIDISEAIKLFKLDVLPSEIQDKTLLVYLLKEGYIDDHYNEYITYFYEGKLTYKDNIFIKSIQGMNPLGFNYKLNNVKNVVEHVHIKSFRNGSILNYDLFDYIIKNKHIDKCKELYSPLIEKLNNISEEDNNSFVIKYISRLIACNNSSYLDELMIKCFSVERLIRYIKINEYEADDIVNIFNYIIENRNIEDQLYINLIKNIDIIIKNRDAHNEIYKVLTSSNDENWNRFKTHYTMSLTKDRNITIEEEKIMFIRNSISLSNIWKHISKNENVYDKTHIENTLYQLFSSIVNPEDVEKDESLNKYISSMRNFFTVFREINTSKKNNIRSIIKILNIKLNNVDVNDVYTNDIIDGNKAYLLTFIEEENLYKVNEKMLDLVLGAYIFNNINNNEIKQMLKQYNYSIIKKSEKLLRDGEELSMAKSINRLINNINENIVDYVDYIYKPIDINRSTNYKISQDSKIIEDDINELNKIEGLDKILLNQIRQKYNN